MELDEDEIRMLLKRIAADRTIVHDCGPARGVRLSGYWRQRGRAMEVRLMVTAFGETEARWLSEVPSLAEAVEMVEWLAGRILAKGVHES